MEKSVSCHSCVVCVARRHEKQRNGDSKLSSSAKMCHLLGSLAKKLEDSRRSNVSLINEGSTSAYCELFGEGLKQGKSSFADVVTATLVQTKVLGREAN